MERKTGKPKPLFAVPIKDAHPFTFAPALEKSGEIPNLESGCELARLSHAAWLGETENGNLKELLVPYPADQMRMWEISPRANSVGV